MRLLIVQGAMTAGPVMFLPAALMIGPLFDAEQIASTGEMLRWIALGWAFGGVLPAFLIWRSQSARVAAAQDFTTRQAAVNSRAILLTALLEAPALFAALVIMLAGFDWRCVPAIAVPVIAFALTIPKARMFSGETPDRLKSYS